MKNVMMIAVLVSLGMTAVAAANQKAPTHWEVHTTPSHSTYTLVDEDQDISLKFWCGKEIGERFTFSKAGTPMLIESVVGSDDFSYFWNQETDNQKAISSRYIKVKTVDGVTYLLDNTEPVDYESCPAAEVIDINDAQPTEEEQVSALFPEPLKI